LTSCRTQDLCLLILLAREEPGLLQSQNKRGGVKWGWRVEDYLAPISTFLLSEILGTKSVTDITKFDENGG